MTPQRHDPRLGIALMALTSLVFSIQDGLSRHLAEAANTLMIVTVRFWFLAAFVVLLALRQGGLRATAATRHPLLQALRGVVLVAEVCILIWAFTALGLATSHAVFAAAPLLVAALSGPLLGERVGWRRWAAIAVGFCGILVILRPGAAAFDPRLAVPLLSALMWALYVVMTRRVQREDSGATSLFWTGVVGAGRPHALRALGLGASVARRLGLDGGAVPDRAPVPVDAYQDLRGGRGQRGAALRLSPARLRLGHRRPRLRRGAARHDRGRRGGRRWGRGCSRCGANGSEAAAPVEPCGAPRQGRAMAVLVLSPLSPPRQAEMESLWEVHRLDRAQYPEALLDAVGPRVRAVVTDGHKGLTAAQVARLPGLGLVASGSAGLEGIDRAALDARGVALTNPSAALAEEVADLALALTLAAWKRLPAMDSFVRSGDWARAEFPLGRALGGRCMGILGLGTIGAAIARRAEAFGLRLAYHSRRRRDSPLDYEPTLLGLAERSDILMVVVPGGAATKGMVDSRRARRARAPGASWSTSRAARWWTRGR
jgi:hypothetical protein